MPYPLCRHIKTNGLQCQSPALHSGDHCFYHTRLHEKHSPFRHTPEARATLLPGVDLELSPLEDRESIQVALSLIINSLATGRMDTRKATALFYGLQLASSNAARLDSTPYARHVVRAVCTSPQGIDLAEPGATGDVADLTTLLADPSEYGYDDEADAEQD